MKFKWEVYRELNSCHVNRDSIWCVDYCMLTQYIEMFIVDHIPPSFANRLTDAYGISIHGLVVASGIQNCSREFGLW
jgi:hypothetical protein